MVLKYLLKIFIVVFLILSIIILINSIGFNLNEPDIPKKTFHEGLDTILPSNQAFCEINKGFKLEQSCNDLTKQNCGLTSCCIWSSDNKCKAGNKSGPIFNSNSNGKTNSLDYYYFQNKCYGEKCPNN